MGRYQSSCHTRPTDSRSLQITVPLPCPFPRLLLPRGSTPRHRASSAWRVTPSSRRRDPRCPTCPGWRGRCGQPPLRVFTPGCQMYYMDRGGCIECAMPVRGVHSWVSDLLHGPYWLSSICVMIQNIVVKSGEPYLLCERNRVALIRSGRNTTQHDIDGVEYFIGEKTEVRLR